MNMFDRQSLIRMIISGLTVGVLGGSALLLGVEPTRAFFAVLAVTVAILTVVTEGTPTSTGSESEPIPG